KNIRRALSSNLNIHVVKDIQQLNIFYRLYVMTRKGHGLPPLPFKFFKSIWDNFSASNRVTFMITEYKKQAVASIMFFKFKNRVSAEYLGWDRSFNSIRPGTYIYWEAIKLAHSEGYKIFDFGRTSTNNIDLMEFKRRWGTKIVELPQYYYPANMRKKDNDREESIRYKVINIISKKAPDGIFKLLGAFCYRHLG
ncbi:MAG: GNAT family N-acetyltransferase, partial [Deltaproteobacteria bacterium]|nr:GNAT family N-acetyltransferase [Deltaproteobacteria bacterium]